jgi:hypothetical protein
MTRLDTWHRDEYKTLDLLCDHNHSRAAFVGTPGRTFEAVTCLSVLGPVNRVPFVAVESPDLTGIAIVVLIPALSPINHLDRVAPLKFLPLDNPEALG